MKGIDKAGGEVKPCAGHGTPDGQDVEREAQRKGGHIESEGELRGQVHGAWRLPQLLCSLVPCLQVVGLGRGSPGVTNWSQHCSGYSKPPGDGGPSREVAAS